MNNAFITFELSKNVSLNPSLVKVPSAGAKAPIRHFRLKGGRIQYTKLLLIVGES